MRGYENFMHSFNRRFQHFVFFCLCLLILGLGGFFSLAIGVHASTSDFTKKFSVICDSGGGNGIAIRNFSLGMENDKNILPGVLRGFIVEGYSTYLLDQCEPVFDDITCNSSSDSRFVIKLRKTGDVYQADVSSPDYGTVTYSKCTSDYPDNKNDQAPRAPSGS